MMILWIFKGAFAKPVYVWEVFLNILGLFS